VGFAVAIVSTVVLSARQVDEVTAHH
jgi:hypothetical protein